MRDDKIFRVTRKPIRTSWLSEPHRGKDAADFKIITFNTRGIMNSCLSKIHIITIVFMAMFINGCTSLIATFGTEDPNRMENKIYAGVRADFDIFDDKYRYCHGRDLWVTWAFIDMPFSLILDTLFLPYTLAYSLDESNPHKQIAKHPGSFSSSESAVKEYEQQKAMIAAIDAGDIDSLKNLIRLGVPVNKDQDPIDHAIEKMRPEILKLLVENGANINNYYTCGNFANYVHLMVKRKNIKGIQMLIDNGADINHLTTDHETPLHYAARNDFVEAISLLIANGADINSNNTEGFTPLHIAAMENNVAAVIKLVTMGANLNNTNRESKKPVHLAQGVVKEYLILKMKK